METKFTKGKWVVGQFAQKVWADNRNGCIAYCSNENHNQNFYIEFDSEEIKANALLISKAPEMFEMLQNMLNESDDLVHSEIKKDIEQLLKEATEL